MAGGDRHNADEALAVRLAGRIPTVVTYHNDIVKDEPGARLLNFLYEVMLLRGTLTRADRIVATSDLYVERSRHLRRHREEERQGGAGAPLSASSKYSCADKQPDGGPDLFPGSGTAGPAIC